MWHVRPTCKWMKKRVKGNSEQEENPSTSSQRQEWGKGNREGEKREVTKEATRCGNHLTRELRESQLEPRGREQSECVIGEWKASRSRESWGREGESKRKGDTSWGRAKTGRTTQVCLECKVWLRVLTVIETLCVLKLEGRKKGLEEKRINSPRN